MCCPCRKYVDYQELPSFFFRRDTCSIPLDFYQELLRSPSRSRDPLLLRGRAQDDDQSHAITSRGGPIVDYGKTRQLPSSGIFHSLLILPYLGIWRIANRTRNRTVTLTKQQRKNKPTIYNLIIESIKNNIKRS